MLEVYAIRPLLSSRRSALADFERLVGASEKRLLLIAYQICGDLEDARDIVQETFLRAFRYRHSFRAGRREAAWLNRIAVNAAIDHLHRRGAAVTVSLDDVGPHRRAGTCGDGGEPTAEDRLEAKRATERMFALLDRLAPRERAAFVLRYLQGLSTADVARAMGCSRVTVRRHSLRAREKLRGAMNRLPESRVGSRSRSAPEGTALPDRLLAAGSGKKIPVR